MRLNLVQSTLDDLIQSLRKDQPVRVRLGKHPSIHYGGKSQSFHAYPETHRSEIYHSSDDKQTLYFTGVLSHSLEVEKAKSATAATDQALANLEESLNAFERGKESKKTHIISHPDELKGFRGSKSGLKAPTSRVELEKDRFLKAARSSASASPTFPPKSPSLAMAPTSAPMQTKDNPKLAALKKPLIHILAIRAVSIRYLAQTTRSLPEDCTVLAEKYGLQHRIDTNKYHLRDKLYKDLDVWNFRFPSEDDRKAAIDNCIGAFDRMRLERSDPAWQMILPEVERGKGTCLSRLKLRTTAMVDPPKAEKKEAKKDLKKEATKEPKKEPSKTATQKPRPTDKKVKTKAANNTTLTGRVTKKTVAKPVGKVDSKIKSAEFVNSSDDDDEDVAMSDAPAPAPASAPKKPQGHQRTPSAAKPAPKPRETPSAASKVLKAEAPKTETPKPKLEPSKPAPKVAASKRPPSRPSTSPQKPSPLGSSPPANASDTTGRNRSDSQNQSSGSSSSSPLIAQSRNKVTRPAPGATKPAQTNGVKNVPAANPLKRKADADRLSASHATAGRPTGDLEAKRRRAASPSSGGSTGSASPPMSHDLLRQQLREKSQMFKQYYTKYRSLHDSLAALADPAPADLERLQRQHNRLRRMKKEIWDEDRQLRDGLRS
jgi:RNA polymerase II elongation factor ELL